MLTYNSNAKACFVHFSIIYVLRFEKQQFYENVVCIDRRERLEEEKPEKARLNSKSFRKAFSWTWHTD